MRAWSLTALCAVACTAGGGSADATGPGGRPDLRSVAGVHVINTPDPTAARASHGLWATPGEKVTLHSDDPTRDVRVLLYERRGDDESYGVYAVTGLKNGIEVPWPMEQDSVKWDNVPPRPALARLLGIVGASDAASFMAAEDSSLRSEGARALFLVLAPWEGSERGRSGPLVLTQELRRGD